MSTPPKTLTKERLQELIHVNLGARRYFYTKADEGWLDWLWQHGFLDVIKEKTEGDYEYTPPELTYLVRMAEKRPAKVVDIMLNAPLSTDPLNPQHVHHFLQISESLPADQLARVVDKIRREHWVPLMAAYDILADSAYKKMFQTLAAAQEYTSLLVLAGAVLAVRPREEIEHGPPDRFPDNPFYFDELSHTAVFDCLAQVDTAYVQQALALTTKTMAAVIALWGTEGEGETVFAVFDRFPLLEVDFFALELGQGRVSPNGHVQELAAVIKVLAGRLIGQSGAEAEDIRKIYQEQIATLPDSRVMWRLRLYIWSLCPHVFQAALKEAFLRLFEVEHAFEVVQAEYLHALRAGFSELADADKEAFVKRTIEMFSQQPLGSQILSMILPYLNEALKEQAEEAGIQLDPTYEPQPSIIDGEGGWGVARGPLTQEEFAQLPIADIAKNLYNAWSPAQLRVQNTSDDLLHPLNAEGVGNLLKVDMRARLQEYIKNADCFFDRERLDPHYTYAYLRGVQEALQHPKPAVDWDHVIALCSAIKEAGETDPFERETREPDWFDTWLANWDAVHSAMSDLLQALLTEKDGQVLVDVGTHRDQLFHLLGYLLAYPDSSPFDQSPHMDLFTRAINTRRGRAFQAFVLFVQQDSKRFKAEERVHIDAAVKDLYAKVLEHTNRRTGMFLFGYHLPKFYIHDRDWVRRLLPQIFPLAQKELYTAAWEGYLTNPLYIDMFYDPAIQPLYQHGLALTEDDYPPQQGHFREPDEGIAEHLALAFMYDQEFGLDHPLFEAFWQANTPKRHAHFVGFLGRAFVSATDAHRRIEPQSKERLQELWDWLLAQHENPTLFREFGLWIDLEKEIFAPAWLAERVRKTLEKTNGVLDWEHGLRKSIVRLAQAAPQDTLEIARLYLFEGAVRGSKRWRPLHWDEWDEALKILYATTKTRSGTSSLIHRLMREGERSFGRLGEIVGDFHSPSSVRAEDPGMLYISNIMERVVDLPRKDRLSLIYRNVKYGQVHLETHSPSK